MDCDEALDLLDRCYHSPAVAIVRAEVERLRSELIGTQALLAEMTAERDKIADEACNFEEDLAAVRALLKEANEMLAEAIVCGPKLREYTPLRQRINAALAGEGK